MQKWRAIELIADYWIILGADFNEYADKQGNNLMFYSKREAAQFIRGLI